MRMPSLEWTGQFRVPLQGVFRGMIDPWRCHGLEVNGPLRGVRLGGRTLPFFKGCGTIGSRGFLRKSSRKTIEVVSWVWRPALPAGLFVTPAVPPYGLVARSSHGSVVQRSSKTCAHFRQIGRPGHPGLPDLF
jgi:hypothetical protein